MNKRRQFSRVLLDFDATLGIGGRLFPTSVIDISLKGVLLNRPPGWKQEDHRGLVLDIKLVNSGVTLHMQAEVAHAHEDLLGLRFTGMDMDSITHLRRLLELNLGDAELIDREVSALCRPVSATTRKP